MTSTETGRKISAKTVGKIVSEVTKSKLKKPHANPFPVKCRRCNNRDELMCMKNNMMCNEARENICFKRQMQIHVHPDYKRGCV